MLDGIEEHRENSLTGVGGAISAGVVAVLIAGCSLFGGYEGKVLEPPTTGEGDTERDYWIVLVELEGDDVLGADVVYVGFSGSELACQDGRSLSPEDLEVGATIHFTRRGDDVDTSNPPAIGGKDLRAECG